MKQLYALCALDKTNKPPQRILGDTELAMVPYLTANHQGGRQALSCRNGSGDGLLAFAATRSGAATLMKAFMSNCGIYILSKDYSLNLKVVYYLFL